MRYVILQPTISPAGVLTVQADNKLNWSGIVRLTIVANLQRQCGKNETPGQLPFMIHNQVIVRFVEMPSSRIFLRSVLRFSPRISAAFI